MRTDTPQPVRLADYRPPAFLIDETELTFDLSPSATKVTAKLTIRRNGDHKEPLVLDGERLRPLFTAIDGQQIGPSGRTIDDSSLTIPDVPDAFVLET